MALTIEQVKALWNSRLAVLEPEIIRPLTNYYWTRDVPVVEDLDKVANVISLRSIKGVAQGTKEMGGMSWLGTISNDLKGVDYEMDAQAVRVFTAGRETRVSNMELELAAKTEDINVNTEQLELVNDRFQQEAQQVAYLGDKNYDFQGLLNNSNIKKGAAATALTTTGDGKWDAVCKAVDSYFDQAYKNANQVIMPNTMLLSPSTYVELFSLKAPDDRHFSMIDYIEKESLGRKIAGSMTVYQVKELSKIGTASKDRILLYTKSRDYLRFHVRSVWREKSYDDALDYCQAYLWRLAEIQLRRPETLMYFDGI